MSGKPKGLTGQTFGRLTALYRLHNYHKKGTYWLCVCECGNLTEVRYSNLKSGHVKSCGCLRGQSHKLSKTRLWNILEKMKQRCYKRIVKIFHIMDKEVLLYVTSGKMILWRSIIGLFQMVTNLI